MPATHEPNMEPVRLKTWGSPVSPLILLAGFGLLMLLGCSEPPGRGLLEIRVKDHREAIGDFSKAEIIVESVRLSPKVGLKFWQLRWMEVTPSLRRVDLTEFVRKSTAMIFKGEVDSGSYEALHLKLHRVEGTLKKDGSNIAIKNQVGPITLPFSVEPKGVTLIVLDLSVLDMSDEPPAGYELQLEGYEVYNNGKLVSKIPPG